MGAVTLGEIPDLPPHSGVGMGLGALEFGVPRNGIGGSSARRFHDPQSRKGQSQASRCLFASGIPFRVGGDCRSAAHVTTSSGASTSLITLANPVGRTDRERPRNPAVNHPNSQRRPNGPCPPRDHFRMRKAFARTTSRRDGRDVSRRKLVTIRFRTRNAPWCDRWSGSQRGPCVRSRTCG
jgi:hypothetical protein